MNAILAIVLFVFFYFAVVGFSSLFVGSVIYLAVNATGLLSQPLTFMQSFLIAFVLVVIAGMFRSSITVAKQ